MVSFDAGGRADSPAPIEVPSGTRLLYVAAPEMPEYVTVDGSLWRFAGWLADDGTAWADIVAVSDLTVHAKWMLQVADVQVSYAIPNVGGSLGEPTVDPDALYYIAKWGVADEDWADVDAIETAGEYHLTVNVALKDPENTEFFMKVTDFGDYVDYQYLGVAAVNGEERDAYYHDDDFCLSFNYDFTAKEAPGPDPTPDPKPTPDPGGKGGGQGDTGGGAGKGGSSGSDGRKGGGSSEKLPGAGEADLLATALPLVAVAAVCLAAGRALRKE